MRFGDSRSPASSIPGPAPSSASRVRGARRRLSERRRSQRSRDRPGGGVLTRLLLERGASRVIACELDLLWTMELRRRIVDPRLVVVAGDGCDLRYERAPATTRIAGNLPYNVATRIVLAVLERAPVGARAAFLVQREVADRLTAEPGESDYGGLSVLVAARAAARRLSVVLPGSFVPPPAVTSAFVGWSAPPRRSTRRSGPPLPASCAPLSASAARRCSTTSGRPQVGLPPKRRSRRSTCRARCGRRALGCLSSLPCSAR